VGIGTHRVRPRSAAGEPQELVDQSMTDDDLTVIAALCDATNLW